MSFWSSIKSRIRPFLVVADEAGNVLIGAGTVPAAGNPHYTISQRLAQLREKHSKVACILCSLLSLAQNLLSLTKICGTTNDHCADAMAGMPENIPTDG